MKRKRNFLGQEHGFTLIEVIAVLVILGVMASVTVHRIGNFSTKSEYTALRVAIRELNVRESLTWTNLKLISDVWTGDPTLWTQMDTNLGPGYRWSPGPSTDGGTLHFRSQAIHLTRAKATTGGAAKWF